MTPTQHRTPGETYAGYTQLEVQTCPTCGVMFAAPVHMLDEKRRLGKSDLYCPNGHSMGWFETEEKRLRRQLEVERNRAARLAAQKDQAEASARAEKAAKTRFKNQRDRDRRRVAHGVCPCCGRTFKQLSRHMASQHPEFVQEADQEVKAPQEGSSS